MWVESSLWVESSCGWSHHVGGVIMWVESCGWSHHVGGVIMWMESSCGWSHHVGGVSMCLVKYILLVGLLVVLVT